MTRLIITVMAIIGTYTVGCRYVPVTNTFAFGVGGVGITWLAIIAAVIGYIAYRSSK